MKRIILIALLLLVSLATWANEKPKEWKEIQSAILPANYPINQGVSKKGDIKYWIEIEGVSINISESNVTKLSQGTAVIEVVKWVNQTNGKLKYTTRQKKSSKPKKVVKDIDLAKYL